MRIYAFPAALPATTHPPLRCRASAAGTMSEPTTIHDLPDALLGRVLALACIEERPNARRINEGRKQL